MSTNSENVKSIMEVSLFILQLREDDCEWNSRFFAYNIVYIIKNLHIYNAQHPLKEIP